MRGLGSQSSMSLGICFQVRRARWLRRISARFQVEQYGLGHHQAPIVRRHRVYAKKPLTTCPSHFPVPESAGAACAAVLLHSLYRGLHAITSRPPLELESAHSFLPADHRKAQKGEGLRFTLPTFLRLSAA